MIAAIGDVDAVNIVSRPENTLLLDNILGDNINVLVIGEWANNGRVSALKTHWDSLPGVSVSASAVIDVVAADLTGIDFLFYMEGAGSTNTANLTTQSSIGSFITSGLALLLEQAQHHAAGPKLSQLIP